MQVGALTDGGLPLASAYLIYSGHSFLGFVILGLAGLFTLPSFAGARVTRSLVRSIEGGDMFVAAITRKGLLAAQVELTSAQKLIIGLLTLPWAYGFALWLLYARHFVPGLAVVTFSAVLFLSSVMIVPATTRLQSLVSQEKFLRVRSRVCWGMNLITALFCISLGSTLALAALGSPIATAGGLLLALAYIPRRAANLPPLNLTLSLDELDQLMRDGEAAVAARANDQAEPTQEYEGTAPLLASMVDVAARSYAEFWADRDLRPETEEGDKLVCESIRKVADLYADHLRQIDRLRRATTVDLNAKPFPPPANLDSAFRSLMESYMMMATIRDYDDLLHQPLVPWPEIQPKLEEPNVRKWMAQALAGSVNANDRARAASMDDAEPWRDTRSPLETAAQTA
jgi:hypothetical protein